MIQRLGQNLLCVRLLAGFDQVLYGKLLFSRIAHKPKHVDLYIYFLEMFHYLCIFQGHGLPTFIHALKGRIELEDANWPEDKGIGRYLHLLSGFIWLFYRYWIVFKKRCTFALNLSSAVCSCFGSLPMKSKKKKKKVSLWCNWYFCYMCQPCSCHSCGTKWWH